MNAKLALLEAVAHERLRRLAPEDDDAGNGTPLTAATATLIALDAAKAGVEPQHVARLGDDVLADAMRSTRILLNDSRFHGFRLPFGTDVDTYTRRSAIVENEIYHLVAGRSGLISQGEAPDEDEGSNLDLLLDIVACKVARRRCRRLGRPKEFRPPWRSWGRQLAFAPCAEAGGISLEVNLGAKPLDWRTRDELAEEATCIVNAMVRLWSARESVACRARALTSRIERQISEAGAAADRLSIARVIIGGMAGRPIKEERIDVDFATLDDALRPGVQRAYGLDDENLETGMAAIIDAHTSRSARVSAREPARIDDLAAEIARASPEGEAAVLARLATGLWTEVALPRPSGGTVHALLSWRDHVIAAELMGTDAFEHQGPILRLLDAGLPDSALVAALGRRLDAVVELPFDAPFPIRKAERDVLGSIEIEFATGSRLVDVEAGAISSGLTSW